MLHRFISEIKDSYQLPPIIITVCQVPVNFNLWLTQNELKYSQKIVFIDRFTYKRAYNKNIPDDQKTMIHFGTKFPMIDSPKDNNETGFIANNESEFVYYATLLSKDKDKRIEMGNLSRQRLIEHFSWEQTVNSYKQLFEEISLMHSINISIKDKSCSNFCNS